MNRIDAFFTMFSLFLVWLFCIYLLPITVMMFVYTGIAAWSVGVFIGNVPGKLSKTTDKDILKEMFEFADKQKAVIDEMAGSNRRLLAITDSQQAFIDQLMFEYCPDEMTPEQIGRYEANVRAVSQQQEDEINRALH